MAEWALKPSYLSLPDAMTIHITSPRYLQNKLFCWQEQPTNVVNLVSLCAEKENPLALGRQPRSESQRGINHRATVVSLPGPVFSCAKQEGWPRSLHLINTVATS